MKIKHIKLQTLLFIETNNFIGANGFDYVDYVDEIRNRIWELSDKKQQEQIKERLKQEELKAELEFTLADPEVILWSLKNFERLVLEGLYDHFADCFLYH